MEVHLCGLGHLQTDHVGVNDGDNSHIVRCLWVLLHMCCVVRPLGWKVWLLLMHAMS